MSRSKLSVLVGVAALVVIALFWVSRGRQDIRRGPYLQSVTPFSIWVVWDTRQPSLGQVEYGPTSDLGLAVEESQAVLHHEVELTGLQPYSDYFYRVDGGKTARFRTAAGAEQTSFRFIVLGDTREGRSIHNSLIRRMLDHEPDFVINTGDMVETGQAASEWDDFFRIEAPLLRTAPLYPTLGNHEDFNPPLFNSLYRDIFHLPGNELWYAFDYGNARFICLKVDGYAAHGFFPEGEQLSWLEQELATSRAPWVFVFFHIGMFTSREEGFLETGVRDLLEPLFKKYRVDAVFMGHHHSYERILVNGITYIVTAGGGAPLYEFNTPEPGSQAAVQDFHFTLFEVNGDRLVGQAIGRKGQVLDRFVLQADGPHLK
jgi:predicted phosphodiesterase